MYCTVCGYGGETKSACPRCGATGSDLIDIPALAQGSIYPTDELDLDRDEIGFTNPNLHRRADKSITGTYETIDYPIGILADPRDFKIDDMLGRLVISKYIGEDNSIQIPDVLIDVGVTTIAADSFSDTDVVYVEIPEGIKIIE